MLYAVLATDVPDSASLRNETRARHLEYVQVLVDQGRVIVAGPHPAIDSPEPGPAGFTGSLIIAEFDSLADAEAWIIDDPYNLAGVFSKIVIRPFIQVVPW